MRSTNTKYPKIGLKVRPWTLSILASILIIAASGFARIASGSVRGGGAYVSGAAMENNGVGSQGEYLALTYRRGRISNLVDFIKVAVGFEFSAEPKTPGQYDTVKGAEQTEESRQLGGEVDLDQAADAAWAAAHSIAQIELPGVSSVLLVTHVEESVQTDDNFDAASIGAIRVAPGDRILKINGEPASATSWETHVSSGFDMFGPRAYGREVELLIGNPEGTYTVVLPVTVRGSRENLGVYDIQLEGTIGIDVEEITLLSQPRPSLIVPEHVTGPSAGLIHTLVYLDALTEGDLTGGLRIAATGTVNSVGRVGRIGGMRHKATAAAAAGADVLFVPVGNREEAERYSDGIRVVTVVHASDAVRWLCQNGGVSTACYTTWIKGPVLGIPDGYEHLETELLERNKERADLITPSGPR